jgi:hypothetical protein
MAMLGTGVSINIGGVVAGLLEITGPSAQAALVRSTAMGATAHAYLGGLPDYGDFRYTIQMQAGCPLVTVGGAAQQVVITWPDSGATTWTFDAIVQSAEPQAWLEEVIIVSVSMKVTGTISVTP